MRQMIESYIAIAQPRAELGGRAEARTKEIERCLKMKPEFIFMMDSDQTAPASVLTSVIRHGVNTDEVDIYIIDAPNKDKDDSNIYKNPDGTLSHFTISCCLIRASVFETLPKPWFRTDLAYILRQPVDGKNVFDIQPKSMDDNVNEDTYFSRQAIEAGLRITIVPGVKSKHFQL